MKVKIVILISTIIGTIINAFAFSSAWLWFIVPFGIMPISPLYAYILSVMIKYFSYENNEPFDEEKYIQRATSYIGKPLLFWLVCYIVHLIGV